VTISLAATNLNWPAAFTASSFGPYHFYPLSLSYSISQLLLHLVVGLYLLLAPQLLALTTDPLLPLPSLRSSQFMSNMKICVACPFFAFPPSPYFCPCFFLCYFGPCPSGHILSCCSLFSLLHFILHFYFRFPARCSVFSCPTPPSYCPYLLCQFYT